jgi:hypothetical protein
MSKRITIVLQDDLIKKLRMKQSKMIQNSSGSVSFSSVVNDLLKNCLKTK